MCMMNTCEEQVKKDKMITLDQDTFDLLTIMAKKDSRDLKNYIQVVLTKHVEESMDKK